MLGGRRLRALLGVAVVGLVVLGLVALRPLPEASAVTGGGEESGFSNYNAVGRIQSSGGTCTGTLLDDITRSDGTRQGVLLTAAHCKVELFNRVRFFEFENGNGRAPLEGTVAEVRNHPQGVDITLALVTFGRTGRGGPNFPSPVIEVEYGFQEIGTPATLVGYGFFDDNGEFKLPGKQRQGIGQVSGYGRTSSFAENRYQLTGFTGCGGDSGGPILVNNKVIAVQTNASGDVNNRRCGTTNFAMPLLDVRSWLESTREELRG
jgi:hypothetical protein